VLQVEIEVVQGLQQLQESQQALQEKGLEGLVVIGTG